jgi:hypothetical protein
MNIQILTHRWALLVAVGATMVALSQWLDKELA